MKILGIETSCDETAAAVVAEGKILSNVVASQTAAHAPFGGVVPEIASRHHVENLPAIVKEALRQAGCSLTDIDGIAATHTPGLLGALLVGLQYAKSLAFALNKPFVGVNHLEGHLNALFLEQNEIDYPYLGLIVSGGHTHLYRVKGFGHYELLGATRDDAAGEAFDKVAKLLGLGYPGGARLEALAAGGNPEAFRFTQPKMGNGTLDFSFSGVKTACLLQVKNQNGRLSEQFQKDLAAGFQEMVTNFLRERAAQAAKKYDLQNIVVSGGVACNQTLRQKLQGLARQEGLKISFPSPSLCTDNGAMIAYVGGEYLKRKQPSPWSLNARASSEL
ncbi:MAG: tRNA (adenosine(37)-N6)-threonylcarbamoyltransferase complex transferase subunit TsaD [Deltaproteobacteria bacterium]|nr:tRNA (adenosine(37)-N6)-threonylcarbamoyltransferase complex transferase subunit TsaD [Deltaproteobacteria bacterium]